MRSSLILCLIVLFNIVCVASKKSAVNNRPIIGILTQPTGDSLRKWGSSYIAASYVKYVESGGARAVPVFHNSTKADLDWIFSRINGLLLPGGGSDLNGTQLELAAAYLYQKAIDANNNGDYFPIEGHCMGFELLAIITSNNTDILVPTDAENITLPLQFESPSKASKWFGNAPSSILNILATQPVTMNNHMFCVTPDIYSSTPALNSFYNVLATSVDRQGERFVAAWEAIKYPIYGMQFHAEKPQFEWDPSEVINHSSDSIIANSYFSRFLVDEARKSTHHFDSYEEEVAHLFYQYQPIYTEAVNPSFEQSYIF